MSSATVPTPHHTTARSGAVLAVIVAAQLMIGLDSSIVTIALPSIGADLHLDPVEQSWIQSSYTLAFGGLLLLGGRLGDLLGRRNMLVGGLIVFSVASLLGGLATTGAWIIAARALQGMGAAVIAPSTLSLLTVNFAAGPERDRALSIYSSLLGAGASIGLVLGGLLTSGASWPWVFFVNVPIGIAVAALAPRFVEQPPRQQGRLDVVGALTSTLGMVALVFGLVRVASDGGATTPVVVCLAVAAALLALFVLVQRRVAIPIMPLRLFADRMRATDFAMLLLLSASMFGMFYVLTQFMQIVRGYGPLVAGLAFLPMTITIFLTVRTMPRMLRRFGSVPLVIAGTLLITTGLFWLSLASAGGGYVQLLVPMLLFGLGGGCSFMPLNSSILSAVTPAEAGAASGVLQTLQWVGGTLGVAGVVTVFGTVNGGDGALPAIASGLGAAQLGAAVCALLAFGLALTRRS